MQAGGQRFESVILHFSTVTKVVNEVIIPLSSHLSVLSWKEFFDILTHKTVSKDFKLETEFFIKLSIYS